MVLELRWTITALKKMDDIAAFIAKDSPVRATTFTQELRKKVELLKAHQLGTPWKVFGTKQFVLHSNYIAIYRVQNGEIQILTIMHSAQQR